MGNPLMGATEEDGAGYDPTLYRIFFSIEDKHFWFRGRNKIIVWAISRFCPESVTFLEIGCGTGFVLAGIEKAFPHLSLSGSEYFEEGLAFARQRVTRAALFHLDLRKSAEHGKKYDTIGLFDVLEHIHDDEDALRGVGSLLNPGGTLIITVPQHPFLWGVEDEYGQHFRRYAKRELIEKVCAAGFEMTHVTSFVSFLFPLMAASRLLPPSLDRRDPEKMFTVAPALNALFESVFNVEIGLISRGVKFPFGGSLLLVAKKN
jgi:SAM-dependent methyltransferase